METIWEAFKLEFEDALQVRELTVVVIRLLLAGILGGVVGLERETVGKSAGLRTHMLVSLGAALFIVVGTRVDLGADISRVVQGVITGIGFLGAGAIIKLEREGEIFGLTTAAGIWLTAAIGVCCGFGLGATALLATLMALVVLEVIPRVVPSRWLSSPTVTDKNKPDGNG